MKHKNLYLALDEIESKENLIDLFKYDESNSWIHVKYGIFRSVINLNQIKKNKEIKFSLIYSIIKNLYFLIISKKKSKQLFFGTTRGFLKRKNEIIDIYLINKFINKNETKMFMTLNSFDDIQKFNPYINENKIVFDNLIYNIYVKFLRPKSIVKEDFKEIISILEKNDISIQDNTIKRLHNDYILKYNFYNRIIRKYKNAESAIVVSSHSKTFITAALKKQKIQVAEVQHGIIGKSHIGYNFKCNINKLPTPDILYVYNDFWKKEILLSNFTKDIRLFSYYKYENITPTENKINRKYIIFTGQGYFYKEIERFLENGISYLSSNNYILIYKPHPSEESKGSIIKKLCEANSDTLLYDEQSYSTEYLIQYSIAHISVKSSCHFDAISIIGKTNILSIKNYINTISIYSEKYPNSFHIIDDLKDVILN